MNQLLKKKSVGRFLMDWAAVIALVFSIIVFTIMQGQAFFSAANATNILRAMSITTIFAIAATVTMAPDGFDMSACTLASFSAYIFASSFVWYAFAGQRNRYHPVYYGFISFDHVPHSGL